jgi:hypothetical protein
LIDIIGLSDLDPCGFYGPDGKPFVETAKEYYVLPQDGLQLPWHGPVYCNPPYDYNIHWIRKCRQYHADTKNDVIALIFSKTDTNYFQDHVPKATGINFIAKKLRFIDAEGKQCGPAPSSSVLVAFGEGAFERIKKVPGWCLRIN